LIAWQGGMLYALEIDLDDAIEEFKRCPKHSTTQTPESHEKRYLP
jgi:hypothetical protein